MATNNYPPIVSKYHSDCTACGAHVRPGDRVNWTKGIKGVTCLGCPMPVAPTAKNGTTPTSASDPQLQAALADGQALRKRMGELQATLTNAYETIALQSTELARVRTELATSQEVRLAQAAHITALVAQIPTVDCGVCHATHPGEVCEVRPSDLLDADLIDVMAPGGVERWLEHDLAQIAVEKAAKERQAIPVITDDCPI